MSVFSIQNMFSGLFQKSCQWVDKTVDNAIAYIGNIALQIPVYRDVSNVYSDPAFALSAFSESLSKLLRYSKYENLEEDKRNQLFHFFKRQILRGSQGLSFLNPKEAAVLLWKNIKNEEDHSYYYGGCGRHFRFGGSFNSYSQYRQKKSALSSKPS